MQRACLRENWRVRKKEKVDAGGKSHGRHFHWLGLEILSISLQIDTQVLGLKRNEDASDDSVRSTFAGTVAGGLFPVCAMTPTRQFRDQSFSKSIPPRKNGRR